MKWWRNSYDSMQLQTYLWLFVAETLLYLLTNKGIPTIRMSVPLPLDLPLPLVTVEFLSNGQEFHSIVLCV